MTNKPPKSLLWNLIQPQTKYAVVKCRSSQRESFHTVPKNKSLVRYTSTNTVSLKYDYYTLMAAVRLLTFTLKIRFSPSLFLAFGRPEHWLLIVKRPQNPFKARFQLRGLCPYICFYYSF